MQVPLTFHSSALENGQTSKRFHGRDAEFAVETLFDTPTFKFLSSC